MKNKYLLLDGNNLVHIAFHRAKSIVLKNKRKDIEKAEIDETDFQAIESMMYHVFLLKLHKHYKKFKDCFFIVCWDNPGSHEWRREIYPEYKNRRVYDKDPVWRVMFNALTKIQNVLKAYPMTQVTIEKLEADDILYAYSKVLKDYGEVTILSGDSDLIQAVQEFGVKLYHPITDKYVKCPTTYNYVLWKAIQGDHTDDIPGLYGYGPVKSTKLAEAYEKDKHALDNLTKEQQDTITRNLKIIRIGNNPNLSRIELKDVADIQSHDKLDFQKIKKFYFDNKLKQLLEDFDTVVSIFA